MCGLSCCSNSSYSCSSTFRARTPPSTRRPHPHVHTLCSGAYTGPLSVYPRTSAFLPQKVLAPASPSPATPPRTATHICPLKLHTSLRCALPGAFSPTLPLAPGGEARWACRSFLQKKSLLFLNREILSGERGGCCS